ncbi:hypothetical protein JZ751_000577 [Albula glossodonta]|uniref:Serum response factor-binding protein 1 n=1 Tax=Albula glossodonta TaxID=121402 RepID=A0A8T2PWH0_9TELE|nr:hypothetical protein JZ751_000577 [Albula glossodonta]
MAEVLNLNNEVVKMRKEVKKARALIIRKLTRQIAKLKKKKGNESEVEKNQRRAARLLEEIHEMKLLKPDHVTKAALMKNLSFEKVCKNPSSTLTERAIARIATHPQINKRILEIKAAIKAFKEERRKPAEGKASKTAKPVEPKMDTLHSDDVGDDDDDDDDDDNEEEEEEKDAEEEEGIGFIKDNFSPSKDGPADQTGKDVEVAATKAEVKATEEDIEAEVQPGEKLELLSQPEKSPCTAHMGSQTPPVMIKETQKSSQKGQSQQNCPDVRVKVQGPEGKKSKKKEEEEKKKKQEEEEVESDLELSDNEEAKEYFDDSTEERFCKQSSQSEDSGDEDDFFLGKVSKFKKRKTDPVVEKEKKSTHDKNAAVSKEPNAETEGKQNSKAMKLESVFCGKLSGARGTPGNRGGRPGGFFKQQRFQNKKRGPDETKKPPRFQKFDRKPMPSKFQRQNPRGGPYSLDRSPAAARGNTQFEKQKDHKPSVGKPSIPSQQALHPSWEASKRRKEQQAQITVFQGKKIKFDDD